MCVTVISSSLGLGMSQWHPLPKAGLDLYLPSGGEGSVLIQWDDWHGKFLTAFLQPWEFVCVRVWSLQPESWIQDSISFFVVIQLMISSKSITALCLGFLILLRGADKLLLPQAFKSTHIVNIKAKINASCPQTGNICTAYFSSPCPMVSRLR